MGRLLVKDLRFAAVAHPFSLQDVVNCKFRVLAEGMEGPAVGAQHDVLTKQETGPGNNRADPQLGAGAIQESSIPQEPEGIASGNPVVTEILGVAVAGDNLMFRAKDFIHPGYIVLCQQVVGIKDKVSVEIIVPPVVPDLGEQEIEGVALAHMHPVPAFVDHSPRVLGNLGSGVSAVVCNYKGDQIAAGVVLPPDALQQLADDRLLVPGGDQHSIPPDRAIRCRTLFPAQRHGDIQELIKIAQKEQDADYPVDGLQNSQRTHDSLLSRAWQMARYASRPRPLTAIVIRNTMAAKV